MPPQLQLALPLIAHPYLIGLFGADFAELPEASNDVVPAPVTKHSRVQWNRPMGFCAARFSN
jgi:hypothetical protein